MEGEGTGPRLVRPVGIGLAVEQQPHHLEVTVVRGHVEPSESVLPRAVVGWGAAGAGEMGPGTEALGKGERGGAGRERVRGRAVRFCP